MFAQCLYLLIYIYTFNKYIQGESNKKEFDVLDKIVKKNFNYFWIVEKKIYFMEKISFVKNFLENDFCCFPKFHKNSLKI